MGKCAGCGKEKGLLLIPSVLNIGIQIGHIPSFKELDDAQETQGRCFQCRPDGWVTMGTACAELHKRQRELAAKEFSTRREAVRELYGTRPGEDGDRSAHMPKQAEICGKNK
ncbi:MAG: hypothetical protein HW383_701 [Candidatus Magasanikbacteria bacterium]|nr:hypothetical protein [Candidatus Magasanikbacteria bacterium]